MIVKGGQVSDLSEFEIETDAALLPRATPGQSRPRFQPGGTTEFRRLRELPPAALSPELGNSGPGLKSITRNKIRNH